jgi:hypothetical protein
MGPLCPFMGAVKSALLQHCLATGLGADTSRRKWNTYPVVESIRHGDWRSTPYAEAGFDSQRGLF